MFSNIIMKLLIFFALSVYFKVRTSVFSYVVKSFWYALILLRHIWVKTGMKGSYQKFFYYIRQNRVPYLEIKLEMAKKPDFFVSFCPPFLFLPCILCIFFFFFCSATTTYTTTTFTTTKGSNCKFFGDFHFISR